MKKSEFLEIASKYKATIVEDKDETKVIAFNKINGKKVECVISFKKDGSLDGYEKTYSLIGGFGFPKESVTESSVEREFKRYCYEIKDVEQLRLF